MTENPRNFDLFLSYSWRDRAIVEAVARALKDRGLYVFLDRWYLTPGQPWPQALEQILASCRSAAVFVGPQGMGAWQQREKDLAFDRQARDPQFSVIPVLLPQADPALGFLGLNTWVDLSAGADDPVALRILERAASGEPPGPELEQAARAIQATVCPYRGLRPFREEDAPFFFGRELFTQRLVKAVAQRSLVAVIGPSGSGKSSVVRAGLVPHLRQHAKTGIWDVITLLPGDRPLHALAAALLPRLEPEMSETDRLVETGKLAARFLGGDIRLRDVAAQVLAKQPGTDRLMLVVDQWEELYTLTRDEQQRNRFLEEVLDATTAESLSLVLTLRGDFFGRAGLAYRKLADRLQDAVVPVSAMNCQELECAVTKPAEKLGLSFETGLVQRILQDVGDEPGNLPLLEYVLTGLWERRRGGRLLHAAYDDLGGVQGAMAREADELLAGMSPEQQEWVRRLFLLHLVSPGAGTEDTRRRAPLTEVEPEADPVVRQLTERRLLVVGRDETSGAETVEVAHDCLIRRWMTLRAWLDDDREFLMWRQRLRGAIDGWTSGRGDRGALLRGGPLTEANRWLSKRGKELGADERQFITKSGRRRRMLQVTTALAGICMLLLGLLAVIQWVQADIERQIALSRGLSSASASHLAVDPETALCLALEASRWASGPWSKPAAEDALREALLTSHMRAELPLEGNVVTGAAFSPDGRFIVTAGSDKAARVWDAHSRKPLRLLTGVHTDALTYAQFSPDGQRLVTSSEDHTAQVWHWDTTRDQDRARPVTLSGHADRVNRAVFSPDGLQVVSASDDATARVWSVSVGPGQAALERLRLQGHEGAVNSASFSPDGKRIVTAGDDQTARVWSWPEGKELLKLEGHTAPVTSAAFSPDGTRIVTTGADNTARVWDARSGARLGLLSGHSDSVTDACFSPDSIRIVTSSRDRTARVWVGLERDQSWRTIHRLIGHQDAVTSITFDPAGKRLLSSSRDGSARLWEADPIQSLAVLVGHTGSVTSVEFSADDTLLVTAADDNTATVWQRLDEHWIAHRPIALLGHADSLNTARFDAAGQRVVTASQDGTARIWDSTTGELIVRLDQHQDAVRSATFGHDPRGSLVATANNDGTASLWDPTKDRVLMLGRPKGPSRPPAPLAGSVLSPDGHYLAAPAEGDAVRLWKDNQLVRNLSGQGAPLSDIAFSPDGGSIALASLDGTLQVRVTSTGLARFEPPIRHPEPVVSAEFSPNGKLIVSLSGTSRVQIWDAFTGQAAAEAPIDLGDSLVEARFNHEGTRIIAVSAEHIVREWDMRTRQCLDASGSPCASFTPGHSERVYDAQFSPDQRFVVTASADHTARVWDSNSGALLHVLRGHTGKVRSARFSPDGRHIVTASADTSARVWSWDQAPGRSAPSQLRLSDHSAPLSGASFSPDGSLVLTFGDDHTAGIWDVATGQLVHRLSGHSLPVLDAAFSRDGELVVTASQDKTARIWSSRTGEVLAVLPGHQDWVNAAAFSHQGDLLATVSRDKTVRIWRLQRQAQSPKSSPEIKVCELCGGLDDLLEVTRQRMHDAGIPPDARPECIPKDIAEALLKRSLLSTLRAWLSPDS